MFLLTGISLHGEVVQPSWLGDFNNKLTFPLAWFQIKPFSDYILASKGYYPTERKHANQMAQIPG